jgi:metal-responsive CopG/Arc/MetJ family transcriptional regulator
VKTAISLPDETFDAATKHANELGMSRSAFFAVAAQRYIDDLDRRSLTSSIDAALVAVGSDDSADAAVAAGRTRLAEGDW